LGDELEGHDSRRLNGHVAPYGFRETAVGVSGEGLTLGTIRSRGRYSIYSLLLIPHQGARRNSPVPGIKKPRLTGAGAAFIFERRSDYVRRAGRVNGLMVVAVLR